MMFYVKNFLGALIDPLCMSLIILFCGICVVLLSKKRLKLGKWLAAAGLFILAVSSWGVASASLLSWLENAYPVFRPEAENTRGIKWIVILGGGKNVCSEIAVSGMLSQDAMQRVVEGFYLSRRLPSAGIIVTGGLPENGITSAEAMKGVLVRMGVKRSRVIMEKKPRDTYEDVLAVKARIRRDRFVLVTSAYHMKRAMGLFEKQGMHPVPAPAGQLSVMCRGASFKRYLFSPGYLGFTSRAVHELAGMTYSKIAGQM